MDILAYAQESSVHGCTSSLKVLAKKLLLLYAISVHSKEYHKNTSINNQYTCCVKYFAFYQAAGFVQKSARPSLKNWLPESNLADHPLLNLLKAIADKYQVLILQTFSAQQNIFIDSLFRKLNLEISFEQPDITAVIYQC